MTAFQESLFDVPSAESVEGVLVEAGSNEQSCQLAPTDLISLLLSEHRGREQSIEDAHTFMTRAASCGVMAYFIRGMQRHYGHEYRAAIPNDVSAAKVELRIEFWNRLLAQTDIFAAMPASMRIEAQELYNSAECPPFDAETVRPTFEDLLAKRKSFFAQRVDGIFESLSKTHITNSPSGFSQKMILANAFDKYGFLSINKAEVICDLRGVVGRLCGRGEPTSYGNRALMSKIANCHIGKKVEIDGGAFTVVVYKAGTVHFTVHPDIAIELNSILASLYPLAIPSQFRTHKKKHAKPFEVHSRLLPLDVIGLLSELRSSGDNYYSLSTYAKPADAIKQACEILNDIGAEAHISATEYLIAKFDYDPIPVLNQIIFSGSVPDNASSQFYPTRSEIAKVAASMLSPMEGKTYIEPQAGTGDLAQYLPMESTTCIELTAVRAKVLKAKGFSTIQADFLEWADQNSSVRFSGCLMNPPFSKGRALAHLQAAASLIEGGGRIVAILPASLINSTPLDGFTHEWSEVFVDQFEGTHVRVAILCADRVG